MANTIHHPMTIRQFSEKNYYLFSLLLAFIFLANGLMAIPRLSITADEADHLHYAIQWVKGHPEKVKPFDDASTMPFSAVNTIPRMVQQLMHPGMVKHDNGDSDVFAGRYCTLLVSLITGLFVLKWSTELYGRLAGLFSFFLFTFCPNLGGHSVLVTTDAFSALFTIATAYFFTKSLSEKGYTHLCFFSLSLSLAQLAKQSLTHLYIIFLAIFLFLLWKRKVQVESRKSFLLKSLLMAGMVILVINLGFQFQETGKPLHQYRFRSQFFSSVQRHAVFLGDIPLPFPKPYIQGLDLTKNIDEMGGGRPESSGNIYLLGQSRKGEGFWYYYFVILFFKTPIPVLAAAVFFFLSFLKREKKQLAEGVMLFIMGYFLVYFDFFYQSQVGIRHILMIFPLLFVLLGSIADRLASKKILLVFFLLYQVSSFYYFYPNLISYSNELIFPKRNAYKIMADSNLDYRQSYFFAKQYLSQHPDVRWAPPTRGEGRFIISINDFLDLDNHHSYDWLQPYQPIGQVAHSYLLFDIKNKEN